MAAVIRAPSVCVCLWCQPKDLVVPLVAGATIPQLAAAVENSELFLRLIDFDFLHSSSPVYYLSRCLCRFQTRSDLLRAYSLARASAATSRFQTRLLRGWIFAHYTLGSPFLVIFFPIWSASHVDLNWILRPWLSRRVIFL